MGDSAYSFSLTTFSRTGKLLQIEYALNAVANGRTSLGICAKDGVVIATEKKLSSELVDVEQVHKVEVITPTTGFCYAGVGPDYRVLGTFSCDAMLCLPQESYISAMLYNSMTSDHCCMQWQLRSSQSLL
jgi:20S proteasome alpha/beta subunit